LWRKRFPRVADGPNGEKRQLNANALVVKSESKFETPFGGDSDDFLYCGALDAMRRHGGSEDDFEKRTIQWGPGNAGYSLLEKSTGRVFFVPDEYTRAWDMEMRSQKYLNEDAQETLDRVQDGAYFDSVDAFDYAERSEREKREDEEDKMDQEDRERDEDRRQALIDEDEKMKEYALAGSGMAAAALGIETQGRVESAIVPIKPPPVVYECLCGSTVVEHQCPSKINVTGMSKGQIAELKRFASQPTRILVDAADNSDPVSELPAPPAEKSAAEHVAEASQLEAKQYMRQDFQPAPDKAPVVAKEAAVQTQKKEEEVKVVVSRLTTPPLTQEQKSARQKAKRLRLREKKALPQLPVPLTEAKRGQAPQIVPTLSTSVMTTKKKTFLEAGFQRKPKVLWIMSDELKQLPGWSEHQTVRDFKTREVIPEVSRRYCTIPDGRKLIWDSRTPQTVEVLPKPLLPVAVSAPSLSVLLGNVLSISQSAPGFPSQVLPPSGPVPLQANTVSPPVAL